MAAAECRSHVGRLEAAGASARYWWSANSSQTGVASTKSIAARSSSRRAATTSSPATKPPQASQSVGFGGIGRGPTAEDRDHGAARIGGEQMGGTKDGVVEMR